MKKKLFQSTMLLSLALLLSGCELALFDSSGVTGKQMGDTILLTMGLMLIVVIPTILMTIWIPFKYHASKKDESYDPEWEHSSKIEFFAWGVPIVIIIVLATITYITSYSLDPRKELVSDKKPLTVQVVAMDWKWLFLFPEEKIAVVNEVAFPVNTPVKFLVTSQSTMNSFYIPKLGGQIYAMAGMENRINLMANEIGEYRGISANYSGFGFAGMRFKAKVTSEEDFEKWVEGVKASGQVLTGAEYDRLIEKTRDHEVEYFSSIDPLQFKNIIESFIGAQNGSN